MPTHVSPRPMTRPARTGNAPTARASAEWRCTGCGKLLGIHRDGLMHLSFARSHEYLVGFPATATCRGCGTLNHATAPAR